MGSAMVVFGLVPGLFHGLAEGVREGIYNFAGLLSARTPIPPRSHVPFSQPRWLAAIGAALIAVTVLAYFSD